MAIALAFTVNAQHEWMTWKPKVKPGETPYTVAGVVARYAHSVVHGNRGNREITRVQPTMFTRTGGWAEITGLDFWFQAYPTLTVYLKDTVITVEGYGDYKHKEATFFMPDDYNDLLSKGTKAEACFTTRVVGWDGEPEEHPTVECIEFTLSGSSKAINSL